VNFFQQQDQARSQTRWLVFAFVLAVAAIVLAINFIVLVVVTMSSIETEGVPQISTQLITNNVSLLAGTSLATVAIIVLASMFKTAGLRSGGGKVARDLGGTLVDSDTRDTKRRRLRNVVEEIALASGVPVPEIYILEQEAGINAFAAGFTPSDAAVAVTRGALEKLNRDELQGVIAHEFSHILNGDMRINIRLMGTLFGVLLIALIGRRILIHSHFAGRSSRDKGGMVVILAAVGLMAVGYIGLFFGRWIKAAVSRQREYLADASAVQFTRDPEGIAGALKKIAVYSDGSYLNADTEELSHMLFGDGQKMMLFSTHPPLNERITRIDPGFRPEDLLRLAKSIQDKANRTAKSQAKQAERAQKPRGGMFDAGNIIDQIGKPDWERMLMAAAIAASIPDNINQAAHSTEWAPEVLFYTLLDQNAELMEQQLLIIAQRMGADSEAQVSALLDSGGVPRPEQRLPLLEMAFPALKRRPPEYVSKVLSTVNALIEADGRVDVFEYLLSKVITQHLWESQNPQSVKLSGNRTLAKYTGEARQVLAILASHGHADPGEAEAAYQEGLQSLESGSKHSMVVPDNWVAALDAALPKLDRLKAAEKEKLVHALATVVLQDGQLLPTELELLRVICDLIHVPLPLLGQLSPPAL
jgi:Zn-dependent protease with chaperone function